MEASEQPAQNITNEKPIKSKIIPGPIALLKEILGDVKSRFYWYAPYFLLFAIGVLINLVIDPRTDPKHFDFTSFYLFFFISICITAFANIAFIINLNDTTMDIFAVYNRATAKIIPYIGVVVLTTLIIVGGVLLFIIPGLIFSYWYFLSSYVLLSENTGITESMKRSKAYMKGMWVEVTWKLSVVTLLPYLALLLIGMLFTGIFITFHIGGIALKALNLFDSVILGVFMNSLNIIAVYKVYGYIKKNKPQIAAPEQQV